MKRQLLFLLFAVVCASCAKERISASGKQTSEVRSPGRFSSVSAGGSNRIHIVYGSTYEVQLRGSDNLIAHFETRVVGGELHLGYDDFRVSDDDVEVFVTLPELKSIDLSGSGEVTIRGSFPAQETIDFRSSGSGHLQVLDTIQADALSVAVSGSGMTDAQKIFSRTARVEVSGSGDVKVNPREVLNVNISGSAKVYYGGNPKIESSISGSGSILKL